MNILKAINPITWYQAYKTWKNDRLTKSVSEFAHRHKNLMVIVLDPAEDTMFMAYNDQQVFNKIKTVDGKNRNIVRGVLKESQFKANIDFFLVAILEGMELTLTNPFVVDFIKWVDGATYRIAADLQTRKEEKIARREQNMVK